MHIMIFYTTGSDASGTHCIACSVLSKKVLRAFACRVLSMKLGFTKDQISRLTDDEINDHMDREYPRLSKAELEAELQRIAKLRVTRDPDFFEALFL
ncbi:hypothetical protein A2U01_0053300, partial [Trifolium medium]|nr:hypothetical protein [Trifolium medium]